jgi:hypothetical protein
MMSDGGGSKGSQLGCSDDEKLSEVELLRSKLEEERDKRRMVEENYKALTQHLTQLNTAAVNGRIVL